jgi:hypothetical protein
MRLGIAAAAWTYSTETTTTATVVVLPRRASSRELAVEHHTRPRRLVGRFPASVRDGVFILFEVLGPDFEAALFVPLYTS